MPAATAYDGAFAAPVFDAQATFRSVMDALARPAEPVTCVPRAFAPAPLGPLAASVALALVDAETPVWLDPRLAASAAVKTWFAFHTGAPLVADPADAAFAFIVDPVHAPPLAAFAQGTAEYPDRSTTLVVQVERMTADGPAFRGPGILGERRFSVAPAFPGFQTQWAANRTAFPAGWTSSSSPASGSPACRAPRA